MVLVTGATGLLGSHILFELLSAGEEVRAIKRNGSNKDYLSRVFSFYSESSIELLSKISWFETDLCDPLSLLEAMEGISDVYHCAALISYNRRDRDLLMKANVEGTANIVNAALSEKVRKFCHVSSIAALGRNDGCILIDEQVLWKQSSKDTGYAVSKYYAEAEVWRAVNEGLNAVIVNPSVIIGPVNFENKRSDSFSVFYEGLKFYPSGSNGFVDVRDVAKLMISIMKSDISGERFIISSENISYREFCRLLSAGFNIPEPFIPAGKFLGIIYLLYAELVSKLKLRESYVTRELVSVITDNYSYSTKKIIETTGFRFIPIADSVKLYTDYYLRYVNNH